MAASDSSAQNVRFNLDAQQMEFALGLDWVAVPASGGGTPGGSDTQVQFNDDGDFGGSANLTFDGTDLSLAEDSKLILGDSGDAYVRYNTDYAALEVSSVHNAPAQIVSSVGMQLIANGGPSGDGDFEPSLNLNNDGGIELQTNTGSNTAALRFTTTTKGFLPPKLTTTQRAAIVSPTEGLMVYDTTLHDWCGFNGTDWYTFDKTVIA